MRIVSIDPAPAKKTTLYDGEFRELAPLELVDEVSRASTSGNCLICWDAPLTGPRDAQRPGTSEKDFSQRTIERFFTQKANGYRVPPGVSVLPYAGCPHWAVSRAALGLPRVGPWDLPESELPLTPIFEGTAPTERGAYVVEIHPAVALWLWFRDLGIDSWKYKREPAALSACCNAFLSAYPGVAREPRSDDELDALVGYTLAKNWVEGDGSVVLLGSREWGSFLVPNVDGIVQKFRDFVERQPS